MILGAEEAVIYKTHFRNIWTADKREKVSAAI